MATPSGIRAGRAFIELSLSDSRFVKGLQLAERRLQSMGRSIAGVGATLTAFGSAGLAGLLPTIKAASDFTETLNKFRQVFGDQADAAEEFANTLSQTVGRSVSEVMDAMSAFNSQLIGLGFDSTVAREMSQQLQQLALDFASFNNLADDEATGRFISAMSGSSEVVDRFGINLKAAALDLKLLELGFPKAAAGATEAQKAIARFEIIRDTLGRQGAIGDAIRTSDQFASVMKRLKASVDEIKIAIGNALLPTVTALASALSAVGRPIVDWIKNNQEIVATTAKVLAVVAGVGAAFLAVGVTLAIAGTAIGGFLGALSAAGAVLGVVTGLVTALISPLGLVAAAAGAAGVAIVQAFGGVGAVIETLKARFGDLASEVLDVVEAIRTALASGDIAAAGEILWLGLQLQWARGVAALNAIWARWRDTFLSVFNDATAAVAGRLINVVASMQTAWVQTWDFMRDAASLVMASLQSGFLALGEVIIAVLAKIGAAVDFVLGTQIEQALVSAEQRLKQIREGIQEGALEGVGARDRARRERLEEIESNRRGALAALEDDRRRRQAELTDQQDPRVKDAEDALARARRDFEARVAALGKAIEGRPGVAEGVPDDLLARLTAAAAGAAESAREVPSAGPQFGSERAGQIFGSIADEQLAVAKKQLEKLDQTIEEQRRTRQAIENGALAFS